MVRQWLNGVNDEWRFSSIIALFPIQHIHTFGIGVFGNQSAQAFLFINCLPESISSRTAFYKKYDHFKISPESVKADPTRQLNSQILPNYNDEDSFENVIFTGQPMFRSFITALAPDTAPSCENYLWLQV